jgi:hypothetical protein
MTIWAGPFWLAVLAAVACMACGHWPGARRDPAHPGPAGLLDGDADHRHRLRGARPDHDDPEIGTETHTLPVPYKGQV